jgi:hypothetical protein
MAEPPKRQMEMTMRRVKMEDADGDGETLAYWLTRPVAERIGEIERLRKLMHGENYGTAARLSRSDLRIQRRRG